MVLLALAAVVLAVLAYFSRFDGLGNDRAEWGQLGDFIGGTINPLIGLLTLVGLAVTVWLQMRQLELSRQTLANGQHELRQSQAEREC